MPNVNLNTAVIRRLFRARANPAAQPAPTDRERTAAATAADSEDAIGTASPEDLLPVHFDSQDWDRHRRRGFDWGDLLYLADYRTDFGFAEMTGVSAAKSTIVRLHQDRYRVPVSYAVDRSLVENKMVAWLVSLLEMWLVDGLGEFDNVEDAIMEAHFCAHRDCATAQWSGG